MKQIWTLSLYGILSQTQSLIIALPAPNLRNDKIFFEDVEFKLWIKKHLD